MSPYEIEVSKVDDTPTKRIYDIIADYYNGHPLILPKPYFVSMQVEQGGMGAGTMIRFQMKVLGRMQDFRATVSEPEPGRILVETNEGTGVSTKFIVDPLNANKSALVAIITTIPVRDGWAGKVEGWLTKQVLQTIYLKELEQLAKVSTH